MDLAVTGHFSPVAVEDDARVEDCTVPPLSETAAVDEHAVLAGFAPGPLGAGPGDLFRGRLVGILEAVEVEHLGEHDQVGSLPGQTVDRPTGRGQIGGLVLTRIELGQSDLHDHSFSRYSRAICLSSSAFQLQRSAMLSNRSMMALN